MFFLLIPLLLINGIASGLNFINKYRLEVGLPINILDILVFLGLLVPLLPLPRSRFSATVHRAILPTAALFLRDKGELVTKEAFDINSLRAMWYGPAVAGIAAAYLLYQVISGTRQFALVLAVMLTCVCFIGQAATLSRSDWASLAFSMMLI